MSAINKVKELLADADSNECFTSERASNRIRALAGPLAKELVESQKVLKALVPWLDGTKAKNAARAALRMDGLEKAMEG